MRIALCQINPTVGDIDGNVARIAGALRNAAEARADIAVFPELAVSGYPPQDLLAHSKFIDEARSAVERLAREAPPEMAVFVGFPEANPASVGRRVFNSVAVLRGGVVERTVRKRLLPTYDVFDEDRHFERGTESVVLDVRGERIGVTVCEDAWNDGDAPILGRHYAENPVADLVRAGAKLLLNASASPFTLEKRTGRGEMFASMARRHGVQVAFVNQVGGNDDLLFDGGSAFYGRDGAVLARAASFDEQVLVVETESGGPVAAELPTDEDAALQALTMGVRDYARKCGFRRAVLGLSGGIDSALTACIARDALGAENVVGVAMPTRYSSEGSVADARALAEALGIAFRVVGIDDIFAAYERDLEPPLADFGPVPAGDVTFENVQARVRCATLMAISNRTGALLLTTGNKSELAVGYCTLYGDMAGGLAVISDLPKTFVYRVARAYNRRAGTNVIPESTLTKPPSAELRPDQTDQDSLPPYEILDAVVERLVENFETVDAVVAAGFDRATVDRIAHLIRVNEYKRRQMPPGLILSRKAFGPGRRYPIAQRWPG